MNLDEEAINAVKEYFDAITQNAINVVYEAAGSDTTFAEFMDEVNQRINRFSSELVASEVLNLSASTIENYNGGEGMGLEDVQVIIESDGAFDADDEDDDDGIRF
jgi:hypothetical protein